MSEGRIMTVVWWGYLGLVVLGLLLFLPVRDALGLKYGLYRDFGCLVALGYSAVGTALLWISELGGDKEDGRRFTLIGAFLITAVMLLLFCGIQWISEHVAL